MDGWLVSTRPSSSEGGGGTHGPAPRFAYIDKFKEVFPYYLAIGMTYEQFWEQDCELVVFYRKAAQIKQNLRNQDAWLQGAYIYEALGDVAPVLRAFAKKGTKPMPYRKEPFDLYSQQDTERREVVQKKNDDKAMAFMQAFALANNKKFQTEGGGVNG